ncbi:MAG: IS66 family transposase [Candidatus Acidiferrales bacterium]
MGAADGRGTSYVGCMDLSAKTGGSELGRDEQAPAVTSATWRSALAASRDEDKTPLVLHLVRVLEEQGLRLEEQGLRLEEQALRLAALEAELTRLRGGPSQPASNSKPSALSQPTVTVAADGRRPGSAKRSKTQNLPIHAELPAPPKELPPGSTLVRREPFVVQDLLVTTHNTRYWLETWRTPTGALLRGELPAGIGGHFGPGLRAFVLQQHYAAHVPQSRLLEELRDYGVDISAGQVNNLLTEQHAAFHAEKDALLPTALQVFTALSVDDSGAPHQGQYGSCLCLCNEFFTTFHSSDTKERSKFLDVLRCGQVDYVLNEPAWAYLKDQGLPAKVWRLLAATAPADGSAERMFVDQTFADASAWKQHLDQLGIDNAKHRQTLTEAALLGSAIAHGVSPALGIVSDGSAIYDVFVHGLCWIHQERNLAKLTPCGSEQGQALADVLTAVWQLYADLKAYRAAPTPSQATALRTRFDALVDRTTPWPELNAALARMAAKKEALLRVLDRPDLPLHTNTAERDFRDWATKRKISAGTRGALGQRCRDTFLSLKATCKKLGVRFMSYLHDRITGAGQILSLPELLRKKAVASVPL